MKNRKEKLEYLFDVIGEIDDKLLNEALEYKPARKRQYNLGLIAACLAVFVAIVLYECWMTSGSDQDSKR